MLHVATHRFTDEALLVGQQAANACVVNRAGAPCDCVRWCQLVVPAGRQVAATVGSAGGCLACHQ
jgi:hypothetical protein